MFGPSLSMNLQWYHKHPSFHFPPNNRTSSSGKLDMKRTEEEDGCSYNLGKWKHCQWNGINTFHRLFRCMERWQKGDGLEKQVKMTLQLFQRWIYYFELLVCRQASLNWWKEIKFHVFFFSRLSSQIWTKKMEKDERKKRLATRREKKGKRGGYELGVWTYVILAGDLNMWFGDKIRNQNKNFISDTNNMRKLYFNWAKVKNQRELYFKGTHI